MRCKACTLQLGVITW